MNRTPHRKSTHFLKALRLARGGLVGLCIFAYLVLGLYTEFKLMGVKPLPQKLLEDSNFYIRAFRDVQRGDDAYAVWDIGTGFLYPPPALLLVGALVRPTDLGQSLLGIDRFLLRSALLSAANVALLSLMIYGVARKYGYTLPDVWWWFPLGLGFAPFLEVLHVGQINVITQFGIFLAFALSESAPILGGLGLTLGIVTKVTPIAFLGYLLIDRRFKAIAAALIGLLVVSLLTGLILGWQPFVTYVGVFRRLLDAFPLGPNAQSLVAILHTHGLIDAGQAQPVHRALTLYLLVVFAASALSAHLTRERTPLFIVLSIGLALIPNVMWYHHYVFLLLPTFTWLAWRHKHPAVVAWCVLGLTLVQVDRTNSLLSVSHGALTHAFGHLSILIVLVGQIRRATEGRLIDNWR